MNLSERLAEQAAKGLMRRHRITDGPQQVRLQLDGHTLVNFSSNDYLGLANHPAVREAFIRGANEYGVGAGAAHLISGHSRAHHRLEQELAEFTGRDQALLFSTGYMANFGVLTALTDRHDTIIEDKLNHASLIDGAMMSRAKLLRYPHTDTTALTRMLANENQLTGLLATDGVFSMEGDIAPLDELAKMAKAHDLMLMVDDAHGLGVLGEGGRGSLDAASLDQSGVPILMGTLGKAFGAFGAFVAGPDDIIEALIQFARSYVYTTALPPAIAEASRAALKIIRDDDERRQRLQANIGYFRDGAAQRALPLGDSSTAIQPVKMPSIDALMRARQDLETAGFLAGAIRPPTVPAPCLRITLCSEHERTDIDALLDALRNILPTMDDRP